MTHASSPITIKKYANRRLYNTATSSYVTLEHLCQLVKNQEEFVVYDAKTGEDITRSILTQIIVEEEGKGGQHLLPISFLRQIIGFYDDSLGGLVPKYLESSMQAFLRNEKEMRNHMRQALDGFFPFSPLEEVSRQNMALFESAMKLFSPFYPPADLAARSGGMTRDAEKTIADLQDRIDALQQQIDSLTGKGK